MSHYRQNPENCAEKLLGYFNGFNHDGVERYIAGAGSSLGDFQHHFLGLGVGDLTENGVVVGQVGGGGNGDEELRTVGAGTSISHGKQERTIENQFGVEFVGELVAGAASTGAGGVATLDHKTINDPVEYGAVVEGAIGGAGGIGGFVGCSAISEGDKVFDGFRCVVPKEVDFNVTMVGVHDCS